MKHTKQTWSERIKKHNKLGFSLVELIVIIAIMAVMIAVLAPSLLSYVERSRAQKDSSAMDEVTNAVFLAMADPYVYDELAQASELQNVSCYIDTNNEAAQSAYYQLTKDEKVHDQYMFTDDARKLDEVKYYFAGNMRGTTITFAPNTSSNQSTYMLSTGIINKAFPDKAQSIMNLPRLYNAIRSVVGDSVELSSQTYRNSEYTIFVRIGSTGGNDTNNQDAMLAYGQFSGTNLPIDGMQYSVAAGRDVLNPNDGVNKDDLGDGREMIYYSDINSALAAINGGTVDSDSNADGMTANVGVYTANGKTGIALLDNAILTSELTLTDGVELDLNGYSITSTACPVISTTGEVSILGTKDGSKISVTDNTGAILNLISVESGSLAINGGTYVTTTTNSGSSTNRVVVIKAASGTTLKINNAEITATDTANGVVVGVMSEADSNLEITGSTILASSGESLENMGVHAKGPATLTNCSVIGEADYVANAAGTNYASNSRGIVSEDTLVLNNCYVWGSHAGVRAMGSVVVNGGVYEGYGHGAFYLVGAGTTSYFYDATINWAPMREGTVADTIAGTNGAGFYIGGASNITAYFDNCDFNKIGGSQYIYKGEEVPFYGIVLRNSGGEANNAVYVSNSTFHHATRHAYRIGLNGGSTLRVYNGAGNNYDGVAAVNNYSEKFIETGESYAKN